MRLITLIALAYISTAIAGIVVKLNYGATQGATFALMALVSLLCLVTILNTTWGNQATVRKWIVLFVVVQTLVGIVVIVGTVASNH